MNFLSKFKFLLVEIFLFLVILAIIISNFTPGTFLTGWDNLMPELNIWLNLKRSLFAVWQEYQGLGLVGGMGHVTDLIRQIILLPFILILPTSFIRYLWQFAMLFLGTFSIYFGLQHHFKFKKTTSFISSLFYLLNFGTIQYFWAPYEAFSTFWGFFPLLIFSLWSYLQTPTKKNLLKLLIINLLAIPSFYIETLFVVYLMCIFLIFLSFFFFNKNCPSRGLQILGEEKCHEVTKGFKIKISTKIILFILILNSFWLLPFFYFLKNDVGNPTQAIGNLMSSEPSFLRNQKRGTITDFLILRGYYFDFPDSNGSSFMLPWQQHFQNPFFLATGYLLSIFVLVGLFSLVFKRSKNSFKTISIISIFILCAIALLSATLPFSWLNYLLRLSPFINQIFRAPFTKFIVPTIFTFTVLFAFGLNFLTNLITKKSFKLLLPALCTLLILVFSFPVFRGNFFYPKMRSTIPNEYFQMFDYFKNINSTARIANLPSGNYWGWTDYRWGPSGSGFIWYGLQQPVLDRAFDGWNLKNEQYYWELNHALQQKNPDLLKNILDKYSIQYIIFDNNIFFPNSKIFSKNSLSTKDLLDQSKYLKLVQQFNQISIYQFENPSNPYILSNPYNISEPNFFYQDVAFQKYHDYVSTPNPQSTYPFANLFTNRLQNSNPIQIKLNQNEFILSDKNNSQTFSFPKILAAQNPITDNFFRLSNKTGVQVKGFDFPTLTLDKSYLVKVTYRNLAGYPLEISANSDNNQHLFFSTKLNDNSIWTDAWFIIPQSENFPFNSGISITFGNLALNDKIATNDIKSIEVYQIPFNEIVNTQQPNLINTSTSRKTLLPFGSSIFFYKIQNNSQNISPNSYLVLPQTFHSGWLAFYIDGNKPVFLKNHILINGWANGWQISNPSAQIYIIFWPQILQFLGLFFIPITFIYIRKYHI